MQHRNAIFLEDMAADMEVSGIKDMLRSLI